MSWNTRFPLTALLGLLIGLNGCATSPTGQRQLRLFPDAKMAEMGVASFAEIRKETPPSKDRRVNAYVRCVAAKVAAESGAKQAWDVHVFESPQANAFALPGGKIGVYTGILKVASTQDQLAAVLGHEVTHVTADHGNARVSAAYATQAGLQVAQVLAGGLTTGKRELLGLLGLGAQYGILMPYGRGQETESDILGLRLMASAGFDPRAAVTLWQNMGKASGGKQPPEFLSTHPGHEQRIQNLRKRMPQALALFKTARRQGKIPRCKR
jgi:predicted Zn-dependent protease